MIMKLSFHRTRSNRTPQRYYGTMWQHSIWHHYKVRAWWYGFTFLQQNWCRLVLYIHLYIFVRKCCCIWCNHWEITHNSHLWRPPCIRRRIRHQHDGDVGENVQDVSVSVDGNDVPNNAVGIRRRDLSVCIFRDKEHENSTSVYINLSMGIHVLHDHSCISKDEQTNNSS